jgi:hypothetical protein
VGVAQVATSHTSGIVLLSSVLTSADPSGDSSLTLGQPSEMSCGRCSFRATRRSWRHRPDSLTAPSGWILIRRDNQDRWIARAKSWPYRLRISLRSTQSGPSESSGGSHKAIQHHTLQRRNNLLVIDRTCQLVSGKVLTPVACPMR